MTHYPLIYQKHKTDNGKLIGLFVSPLEREIALSSPESEIDRLRKEIDENQAIHSDIKAFHHTNHVKIGIINLPLLTEKEREKSDQNKRNFAKIFNQIIPVYEKQFAKKIRELYDLKLEISDI